MRLAPFVHHLHAFGPGAFGEPERSGDSQPQAARRASGARQFALRFEFAELLGGRPQGLVGVGIRAATQAVSDAEAIVVTTAAMILFNWAKTFQLQLALKFSVNTVQLFRGMWMPAFAP